VAPHHQSAEIMSRAARDLRKLLEEPSGNVFQEGTERSVLEAVESLGSAIASLMAEATISSGGTRYNARLIPEFSKAVCAAASHMAKVARDF
jgi:hypothetical protein